MFPLPSARTCEAGLPSEARIPGIRDTAVPDIIRTCKTLFVPSHPSAGQRDQPQSQDVVEVPSAIQTGQRGQGVGRGRGQSSRAETSGT